MSCTPAFDGHRYRYRKYALQNGNCLCQLIVKEALILVKVPVVHVQNPKV
jgi:hypothetical protein